MVKSSAIGLNSSSRSRGTSMTTIAPTAGTTTSPVVTGNPGRAVRGLGGKECGGDGHLEVQPREEVPQDDDHAGRHPQGVGADEAGLDVAQAPAGEPDHGRHAVDGAVDDPPVEGGGGLEPLGAGAGDERRRWTRRSSRRARARPARPPSPASGGTPVRRGRCRPGRRSTAMTARATLVPVATSMWTSLPNSDGSSQWSRMWKSLVEGQVERPADHRRRGQHDQRQRHRPRGLVGLEVVVLAVLARRGGPPPRPRRAPRPSSWRQFSLPKNTMNTWRLM